MLKQRLVSATILLSVFGAALFWQGVPGAALFTLVSVWMICTALKEFFFMVEKIGYRGYVRMTMFTASLMILAFSLPAFFKIEPVDQVMDLILIIFITCGFFRVFKSDNHKTAFIQHLVSIGGLVYICWTLSFIPRIYFIDGVEMSGRYLVLFLILGVKSSDIGAYFVGSACSKRKGGNHKIAPVLSPGKSWEGFFGGIAASIGVCLLLVNLLGSHLYVDGAQLIGNGEAVILGIIFGSLGFIGDIAESVLKRASGCKDSGSLLPGMGGIMDVVDSLTIVTPLFYCFLKFGVL